jgi:hypothetical protein
MSWLPLRRLPMWLERLLGLWRLWRLLPLVVRVQGSLPLVLEQNRYRLKSKGRVLLDPAHRCLICGTIGANNSLCQCLVGTAMAR